MPYKLRDFANVEIVKAIYHDLFETHSLCMPYVGTKCM